VDFPVSSAFRNRVFALPVHQELTRSELQQIVEAVLSCTKEEPKIKLQEPMIKNQEVNSKNQIPRTQKKNQEPKSKNQMT
jgi:hypothetical protein